MKHVSKPLVAFALCMIMTNINLFSQRLIAYYPFNTNANDSSGNALHGKAYGTKLTCDRFGQEESAYFFDGNSFIEVLHNSKLSFGNSQFSLAAWTKFCNVLPDYSGIIAKGPTTIFYPGYQLTIASSNRLTTQLGDSSLFGIERRGLTPLNDGKWHFVVLTVKPESDKDDIVSLYVDGKLEAYQQIYTHRAGLDVSLSYTTSLFIGKDRNSVRFFKGAIDDIRIYRGALSDSAIQALYHENGWPNSVPNLKILPDGPTEFCEGQSVKLTAPACIDSYQWSNGASTPSITVNTSGTYKLTGYDAEGCVITQDSVAVTVVPCGPDTLTGDLTYNIRSNCPGRSEEIGIPFLNTYYSDSLVGVSFSGNNAAAFFYKGTLPLYLPPTVPVVLPITFRWLRPGAQKIVMILHTSAGFRHRILLQTPVGNAMTPFLSLSEVRVGPKSAPFDTCVTVNNLLDAGVTLRDTVWLGRNRVARMISPAFPFYIGPKGSAQICFRVEPNAANTIDTVLIAGANAPNNCLACFYQPVEVSTRPPRPLVSSVEDALSTGGSAASLRIFPNPSKGQMTLRIDARTTEVSTIVVVDDNGDIVMNIQGQSLFPGTNLLPLDVAQLSSGRYSIIVQSATVKLVEQVTVQK